ncbi:MAG: hypothetical protein KDI53_19065 [Candidatus Accumulibacter sp.]|nr:hypothetical protein [Accumulibacter sp.]
MRTLLCAATLVGSMAVVAYVPTAWARENCPAPAIDRVLCEQPVLRVLRDALARSLGLWQQHCSGDALRAPGRLRLHAPWLADVRAEFDRLDGVAAQDYLGSTFTQRADELAQALSSCAHEPGRSVQEVRIDTVRLPLATGQDEASSLPFVQTRPALVGLRINDALYRDLLRMDAPASPRDEDVSDALSRLPEALSANETIKVSVLWRSSRLLVLQVDSYGCETRCWQNHEQRLFDLRTGDRVEADDLLSPDGRLAVDRLGERSVRQEVRKLRRGGDAQWAPDGLEFFERCLQEWRRWRSKGGDQIVWRSDKRWRLRGPSCPGHSDGMLLSIDSKIFPLASLAPNLSAYGKSLLLGVGDVRTWEPPLAACAVSGAPPDPQGWAARVAEISAGEDHVFLREASGRIWGWGVNFDGALGRGDRNSGEIVAPFVIGDDYLYAGAGQRFSIVVRRDGGLWTWGGGYSGRLGDGGESRWQPARIGEDFILADVDNYGGRALAQDGRLWAWGGSKQPIQVMAKDVTQVRGSKPVLILQGDGGLLAWNELHWVRPGESDVTPRNLNWHGRGFARLPQSRNLELAWRADGSAWAWGRTLAAMATPEALPGLNKSPWPRLVGQDWVDVKTSKDSALVAARKLDGSLWVSQERAMKVRMEPLGCGFADMAFAYDEAQGIHLLALRSDGTLLDYHSDRRDDAN